MTVYYNEIDSAAAHVLECLIKDGVIADGVVDRRSIADVEPVDVKEFTQAHFFAGGGLWSVAARLAGWPDGRVLWSGSCPCQPFSVAGKGKGTDDERHLWPHFHRLITACRPAIVVGEQVSGKAGYGWFDGVRSDLESEDYACEAFDIPACAVNAPHIRQRLYWVATKNMDDANRDGAFRKGREKLISDDRRTRDMGSGAMGSGAMVNADGSGQREHSGAGAVPAQQPSFERASSGWTGSGQGVGSGAGGVGDTDGFREPQPGRGNVEGWGRAIHAGQGVGAGDMADANDSERWSNGAAGHNHNGRHPGREEDPSDNGERGPRDFGAFWRDHEWIAGADGKARRIEPGVRLLVDAGECVGRVSQLRIAGNAIVAPLAAVFLEAVMETLDEARG